MRHLIVLAALAALACTPQGDPAVPSEGYSDDFERDRLGDDWNNTGGPWEIRDGWLHVRGARNRPLWLRRVLPRDVRVEFDVKSMSDEGDIKVEVFGDAVHEREENWVGAMSFLDYTKRALGWTIRAIIPGLSTNVYEQTEGDGAP
ncbi:MAG TPA: hypothetical protein RMG45_09205, partial [Polyangiaceae bacterium LLY-WYZ-15_(1-7)]|nr:hypothetical protein [Polyangiaceae bacterium LLY-WYZ-15_(1-7)]